MAYYILFPEKDSTIYSHPSRTLLNSGHDEILEIVKEKGSVDPRYYPSRVLLKFKSKEIKFAIENIVGGITNFNNIATASLQLYSTEHKNLPTALILNAYAVSQSWDEGSGRYSNIPTGSNGVSWIYRDNSVDKSAWPTSSFASNTTGSINVSGITKGGGTWYTGSEFYATQQFASGDNLDTNFNVTSIVGKHYKNIVGSSIYPIGVLNNGFIVKQPTTIEENTSSSFGEMKYFSVDTHTIYPPRLNIKWDDSIHSKQPSAKQSGELDVCLYRNKKEYNQNEEVIFRIHVRDKYPTRTFVTSSNYLDVGYFTTKSYWSLRDAHTEEEVIPFDDNCTKMSADSEGMKFKVFMNGLQPERYYRILFKHINNEGTTIYDNKYHFKVTR